MVSDIHQLKPDSKNQTQFSDREGSGKIRTEKYQNPEPREGKNIVIKQASGVTVIEPSRAKQPPGPKNSGTRIQRNGKKKDKSKYGHMDDREILVLQVEALQSQLEEQTRLARDQIATLTEDRKILSDEKENSANRDKVKIQNLSDQLRKCQQMLTDSTKDYLKIKSDQRACERKYMADKDQLCLEIDELRDRLAGKTNYDPRLRKGQVSALREAGLSTENPSKAFKNINSGTHTANRLSSDAQKIRKLESQIQSYKQELEQSLKLTEMYRCQCVKLEDTHAHEKQAAEIQRDAFREKSERLQKRIELADSKYKSLEKRRAAEIEGFKSDIKILRGKLKDMEKQVLKITLGGPVNDLEILKDLHSQTSKSKEMQEQIRSLKNQIYSLETDFRNM